MADTRPSTTPDGPLFDCLCGRGDDECGPDCSTEIWSDEHDGYVLACDVVNPGETCALAEESA